MSGVKNGCPHPVVCRRPSVLESSCQRALEALQGYGDPFQKSEVGSVISSIRRTLSKMKRSIRREPAQCEGIRDL